MKKSDIEKESKEYKGFGLEQSLSSGIASEPQKTKSNFFNPNWNAINKAISGSKETRDALRKEQHELKSKIDAKFEQYYKEVKEQELKDKITALKSLPIGADVYSLVRNFGRIPYGSKGKKVKDGRTFMIVDMDGNYLSAPGKNQNRWKIEYERLSAQPLTGIEIANHAISKKITELLVFGEKK